jgi:2'-5' RNA ligase
MFALMPHEDLAKEIDELRKQFAANFGTKKALQLPVHLTLYPPYKAIPETEQELKQLHNWAKSQSTFNIHLKNFDFFDNRKSPVVFINVEKNKELTLLHANFTKQLKRILPFLHDPKTKNTFHPHMTIAYRDVPPEKLPEIKRMYVNRKFEGAFNVKHLYLWRHNGRNWDVIDAYEMKSAPAEAADAQGILF